MRHKNFRLTKYKLSDIKVRDIVLVALIFGFVWSALRHYVLPVFIGVFSNVTIAFFEEILSPIGSIIPVLLLIYAFVIWVCKLFIKDDSQDIYTKSNIEKDIVDYK